MKLAEPITTFTDYILGLESVFLAVLLFRQYLAGGQISVGLWAAGFLATATAALAGGTYHGFPGIDIPFRSVLWKCTLYSAGVTSLCLFSAATISAFRGSVRQVLLGLCLAEFLIYCAWMVNHSEFKYAIYDYAPAMFGILLIQWTQVNVPSTGAPWIIAGLVVSFVGAGIQQSGVRIGKHLGYNDLYHMIQMVAMFLLYRGGSALRDKEL